MRNILCHFSRNNTLRQQGSYLSTSPVVRNHSVRVRELFELRGKVALVTGGARRLGLAFSEALAEYGADVAVLDIEESCKDFEEISKKYSVKTSFIRTDVTDATAVDDAVKRVASLHGRIDICVGSAGIAIEEPFLETTQEQLRKVLSVNTEGLYYTNQSVVRQMLVQGEVAA
jgi:NAD(P)-dependent dehydrogenase (short-subunit alcohol dehydrogenase family)